MPSDPDHVSIASLVLLCLLLSTVWSRPRTRLVEAILIFVAPRPRSHLRILDTSHLITTTHHGSVRTARRR